MHNTHNIKYYWIVKYYTFFACFLLGTSILHNLIHHESIGCSTSRIVISEFYSLISIVLIVIGELELMKKNIGFLHNIYLNTLYHIFIGIVLIILELDNNVYSKFTTSLLLIGGIFKLVVVYWYYHTVDISHESLNTDHMSEQSIDPSVLENNSYIQNIYPSQHAYDESNVYANGVDNDVR